MGDLRHEAAPEPGRDMRAEVEKVMAVIRPAIQADGGDITLVDVDEGTGVVTVELLGACGDCRGPDRDLTLGVERILVQRVTGITAVAYVTPAEELPQLSETTVELKGFSG